MYRQLPVDEKLGQKRKRLDPLIGMRANMSFGRISHTHVTKLDLMLLIRLICLSHRHRYTLWLNRLSQLHRVPSSY